MKKNWGYRSCMFLMGGNLNNGDQAGSAYLNLNNAPGNANWNIAARENGNTFLTGCRGGNNPPAAYSGGHALRQK